MGRRSRVERGLSPRLSATGAIAASSRIPKNSAQWLWKSLNQKRGRAVPPAKFCRRTQMSTLLIIIILLLLFGGGGGYWAYGAYGGAGLGGVLGTVLVILLILWLLGALR